MPYLLVAVVFLVVSLVSLAFLVREVRRLERRRRAQLPVATMENGSSHLRARGREKGREDPLGRERLGL